MNEIYTVTNGINRVTESAAELYEKNHCMVKIFIAGGSASGKSTGTVSIEKRLTELGYRVLAISADDYYKGGRIVMQLMKSHGIGFDDPGAVDLQWLRCDIVSLMSGKTIKEKKYKFGPDPAMETGKMLEPPQILIIEGLFVLREELRDLADIKVFFDIGLHGWLLRRIFRDTQRTKQKPLDILDYCTKVVVPKYEQWILETRNYAEFVIVNEYDAQVEAKNAGRVENQLKYHSELNELELIHLLSKLGADRVGNVQQVDIYYNPRDRDLRQTGESMRIRTEGGKIILTYKGPKDKGNAFARRAKYEFEISNDIMKSFLDLYGTELKTIKKERTIFHYEHLLIAVDSVSKIENGCTKDLGMFVEFRVTTINITEALKEMEWITKRIGLGKARAETRSYVEM